MNKIFKNAIAKIDNMEERVSNALMKNMYEEYSLFYNFLKNGEKMIEDSNSISISGYKFGVLTSGGLWISDKPFSKESLIPTKILFNDPYTICYFKDGSKVTVKHTLDEKFSEDMGVMACIIKKLFGSRHQFMKLVKTGYTQLTKEQKAQIIVDKKAKKELEQNHVEY